MSDLEHTWAPGDEGPLPDLPESCYPPGAQPLAITERKVLVGRIYGAISTSWTERPDQTFDDVVADVQGRRTGQAPNVAPDEIIEVIVARRARVLSEVTVVEDEPPGGPE